MELKEFLTRVESLDEFTPKSKFIEILAKSPDLKESLLDQLLLDANQEWIKKAKKGRFFFLIYDDSWKASSKIFLIPNTVKLKFVGLQNLPTIAFDIHQKLV